MRRQKIDMVGKIISSVKHLNGAVEETTGQVVKAGSALKKIAATLNSLWPPPLPEPGDYVRIIEELDEDYGLIGEVLWIDRRPYTDVHVMLNPFGGGVKIRRPIDGRSLTILTEMEVLAEASK